MKFVYVSREMSNRQNVVTTYQPENVIQPVHTGGAIALDEEGIVLATSLEEDAALTDLNTGALLARVEGVRLTCREFDDVLTRIRMGNLLQLSQVLPSLASLIPAGSDA